MALSISVHDTETVHELLNIDPSLLPSVVSAETEAELVTIRIVNYINVSDAEVENDFAFIDTGKLAFVQSASYNSGSSISATGTVVMPFQPLIGDLLVAELSYAGAQHPSAAPTGWTQLDDLENGTSAWLTTWYHVVGGFEANSYTFNAAGADFLSIIVTEFSNQSGTPINQHGIATGSSSPQATPSETPSVIGTLPLTFIAFNDGTADSSTPVTSSAGWVTIQNPQPLYHSSAAAYQSSVTTDTSTAITNSFTWVADTNISSTILVAPETFTTLFIAVSDAETEAELVHVARADCITVSSAETEAESVTVALLQQFKVVETETEGEAVFIVLNGTLNPTTSDADTHVVSIVQSAGFAPSGAQSTIVLTLNTAPTPGNILVAFTAYSLYANGGRTLTAPDGTWTQIDNLTLANDALTTWWHPVVAGAVGTAYTWTINGTPSDWESGTIYEIAGANFTTPINQHAITSSASTSSPATPTVTPTILGTLPLSGITTDAGSNAGISVSSQSANWTLDQSAVPQYHAAFSSHYSLTTDYVTAISNTFNLNTPSTGGVQAIILIAPSSVTDSPNIEQVYTFSVSDAESEGESVALTLAVGAAIINVSDAESESELVTIAQVYDITVYDLPGGVESGLQGWWLSNEGTGTNLADSSGNGNNGTIGGGTAWVAGSPNGTGSSAGYNGLNYASTSLAWPSSGTIAMWVYPTAYSAYSSPGGWKNGSGSPYVCFDNNGTGGTGNWRAVFKPNGTEVDVTDGTAITQNTWQHIAMTWNNVSGTWTIFLYVNGVSQGSTTLTDTTGSLTTFYMGSSHGAGFNQWSGRESNVRVYNRAISQSEVNSLYAQSGVYDAPPNITQVYTINVSDVETETESVSVLIPTLGGISVSDAEAENELVTVQIPLLGAINVADTETEGELVTIKIPSLGGINVSDAESEVDVVTDIEIIDEGIFVTDSETENELVAIEIFSFINVSDSEAEAELVTIKIPTLGNISVSDTESESDVISDIEITSFINVSDVETEGESVTITLISNNVLINVSDVETENELVTVVIPLLGTISVSDTEVEADVINNIELISFINVASAETENDVVDIEIIDEGIFVIDSETENELVTVNIPLLGPINISDSEIESESVTIIIPEEGTIFVTETESEQELTTVQIPLLGAINVSDVEIENEFVSLEIVSFIKVSDAEIENEFIDIEIIDKGINVFDVETIGEAVFVTIALVILVVDTVAEQELVVVGIQESRVKGPYPLYDFERGFMILQGNTTLTLRLQVQSGY